MPVLLAVVAALLALGMLTVRGSRKRGHSWPLAVAEGMLFPVAWIAWYVNDEIRPPVHR